MASQFTITGDRRDSNGALCASFSSVYRTPHRHAAPESIWTTAISGTSMTWKRSWRLTGVITTGRVRTKAWRAVRRRKKRAIKGPNAPLPPAVRRAIAYRGIELPEEWSEHLVYRTSTRLFGEFRLGLDLAPQQTKH